MKDDTISAYLNALERLMIVEDQPAWAPHLRSRYTLRSSASGILSIPPWRSAAALGVIVGAGYGYRREDGIAVVPIGALGP